MVSGSGSWTQSLVLRDQEFGASVTGFVQLRVEQDGLFVKMIGKSGNLLSGFNWIGEELYSFVRNRRNSKEREL